MSTSLRREVLRSFKALHATRKCVFKGDARALTEARRRINDEYKTKKGVRDPAAIQELLKHARDVEGELRSCVIQATEVEPGLYRAEITGDTVRLDNVPFRDCAKEK